MSDYGNRSGNTPVPTSQDGIDWSEVMDIVTSESTQSVWSLILKLLASQHHIGFGVLDAFLSGDELDQRIALIEQEAAGNEWLRNELSDTLCLDQSDTLSCGQIERLRRAASV